MYVAPPPAPKPALDADALFRQLAAVREALAVVEFPPWHQWKGTDLLEYWLGLRYPVKLARVINRIFSGEATRVIQAGPRGGGKCFHMNTNVRMYDGSVKQACDVVTGDRLMGPDSTPRQVLSTTRGYGPLYTVQPKRGEAYVVNEHHILSLKQGAREQTIIGGIPRQKGDIVNLPILDYIALPEWKRERLPGWRTGVEYPAREVPVDPYYLGIWLGDGTSDCLDITNPEPEIIGYLQEFADRHNYQLISKEAMRHRLAWWNYHGTEAFPQRGNPVRDAMRTLGVMRMPGAENNCKHIPEVYLHNDRETRMQLLAGLIDSDGTPHHGGFDITAKQERLADNIVELCRSLGMTARKAKSIKGIKATGFVGTYWRVSISGHCDQVPLLLARKKASVRRQIKDPMVDGLTVTPAGDGEYCGWETDGDHMFLLADFTVVHNSMQNAALEFLLWVFLDFDVVNIGGSEQQAGNVYAYLQGFTSQYRVAAKEWNLGGRAVGVTLLKETMVRTVRKVDPLNTHRPVFFDANTEKYAYAGMPLAKDSQAFIAVLAASPKQVRGPHAGSERRGGLLVVDEEAEVAADIFNAAKYTVNTGNPSIILRTSTYHNAVGTFAEDFESPEVKGFERHRFSIFDVCRPCPVAKTTQQDWRDLRGGIKRIPGDDDKSVRHLPVVQPDCRDCPHPEYFRDGRPGITSESGVAKGAREPWCGGAAAYAENGWFTWDEIEKLFVERPNDEDFEVELLGLRPSSFGLVVTDREAMADCIVDDELCAYLPATRRDAQGTVIGTNAGAGECIVTIDWGLSGTAAVMVLQNRYDLNPPFGCRVVIQSDDLGHMADTLIYDHCDEMDRLYGVREVWADASHPYQNRNLAARGFDVHIVYFAKMKELGVGSINAHIARHAFRFGREMARTLIEQLRGWRRDKTGTIVKGNDHFPDSLLCGAIKYLDMVNFVVGQDDGGARMAHIVNAVARAKEDAGGGDRMAGMREQDGPPSGAPYTARDVARTSAYTGDRPHAPDTHYFPTQNGAGSISADLPPPPEPGQHQTATERIIADAAASARATPGRFR